MNNLYFPEHFIFVGSRRNFLRCVNHVSIPEHLEGCRNVQLVLLPEVYRLPNYPKLLMTMKRLDTYNRTMVMVNAYE